MPRVCRSYNMQISLSECVTCAAFPEDGGLEVKGWQVKRLGYQSEQRENAAAGSRCILTMNRSTN